MRYIDNSYSIRELKNKYNDRRNKERYVDGNVRYTDKTGIDKYTNDMEFDNSFMTEKEIKDMYHKLAGHMKVKYGHFDYEYIHRTVVWGLINCKSYNPEKSSKLVWFQTILRNKYITDKDAKYNKWKSSVQPIYMSDYVYENGNEIQLEDKEELEGNLSGNINLIQSLISNGDYPAIEATLKFEYKGSILRELKLNIYDYNELLADERKRLKASIKSKVGEDVFEDRYEFKPKLCRVCGKVMEGDILVTECSLNCKRRSKFLFVKEKVEYHRNCNICGTYFKTNGVTVDKCITCKRIDYNKYRKDIIRYCKDCDCVLGPNERKTHCKVCSLKYGWKIIEGKKTYIKLPS